MKEEYFSPQAEMLAFNYASVVSASLDTSTVPTSPSSDTGSPGQGGGNDPWQWTWQQLEWLLRHLQWPWRW